MNEIQRGETQQHECDLSPGVHAIFELRTRMDEYYAADPLMAFIPRTEQAEGADHMRNIRAAMRSLLWSVSAPPDSIPATWKKDEPFDWKRAWEATLIAARST